MIQTKCIFAPKDKYDGIRVSVMSRHTLNDGVTPDKRITQCLYDIHCINLAPPPYLVGRLFNKKLSSAQYMTEYKHFLRSSMQIKKAVKQIAQWVLTDNVTFLCQESKPHKCHRTVLALECMSYVPTLYCRYL